MRGPSGNRNATLDVCLSLAVAQSLTSAFLPLTKEQAEGFVSLYLKWRLALITEVAQHLELCCLFCLLIALLARILPRRKAGNTGCMSWLNGLSS